MMLQKECIDTQSKTKLPDLVVLVADLSICVPPDLESKVFIDVMRIVSRKMYRKAILAGGEGYTDSLTSAQERETSVEPRDDKRPLPRSLQP